MKSNDNSIHTDIMIRAIVKDATGYMATIDPEDLPCNTQHNRCLAIIGEAFDAKPECDEALEYLRRWEDAVRNNTQPDFDGITLDLEEPLNPVSVTLEFFKAALRLEDADEQTELYQMADYMGAAAEILCDAKA